MKEGERDGGKGLAFDEYFSKRFDFLCTFFFFHSIFIHGAKMRLPDFRCDFAPISHHIYVYIPPILMRKSANWRWRWHSHQSLISKWEKVKLSMPFDSTIHCNRCDKKEKKKKILERTRLDLSIGQIFPSMRLATAEGIYNFLWWMCEYAQRSTFI